MMHLGISVFIAEINLQRLLGASPGHFLTHPSSSAVRRSDLNFYLSSFVAYLVADFEKISNCSFVLVVSVPSPPTRHKPASFEPSGIGILRLLHWVSRVQCLHLAVPVVTHRSRTDTDGLINLWSAETQSPGAEVGG